MPVPTYPWFKAVLSTMTERNAPNILELVNKIKQESIGDEGLPQMDVNNPDFFYVEINTVLPLCKHFEIEDDLKELLLRTKAPKRPDYNLKFPYMYLDVSFTKEELLTMGLHMDAPKINGMVIRVGKVIQYKVDGTQRVVGKDLRISVLATNPMGEQDYVQITTFPGKIEMLPGNDKMKVQDIVGALSLNDQKVMADFATNLVYFLNNPEVRCTMMERGEKNIQRRIREGKPILPSSYKITLTGESLRYLNEIKTGTRSQCAYAFDVGGHYRVLNSPFYKEKRGVRIWVGHFTKGKEKGFLVEKYYNVNGKDLNNK